MKKLLLLAAMLAVVAIVAVPALAQDKEQGAEHDGAGSGGSVVAAPVPRDGGSDAGDVSFNAAPADGSSEISVSGPAGDSEAGDCFDADAISLADASNGNNGGDDGGSVIAASAPGCSYVVIEE